jgi:hypothetical protein
MSEMKFDLTYGGSMDSLATVHVAGELAYLNTLQGLVPVKVIKVIKPGRGWMVGEGDIVVRVTATRGAFNVGYGTRERASRVVPKKHVVMSRLHPRIDTNYRWETGEKEKNPKGTKTVKFSGHDLDLKGGHLSVRRKVIDTRTSGDHGADPVGDGTFRMVPSGDIVSLEERNRRLSRRTNGACCNPCRLKNLSSKLRK